MNDTILKKDDCNLYKKILKTKLWKKAQLEKIILKKSQIVSNFMSWPTSFLENKNEEFGKRKKSGSKKIKKVFEKSIKKLEKE